MHTTEQILEVYGPQLGELAWHSLQIDPRLAEMSERHAASILRAVEDGNCLPTNRPVRILEIGAYAHFGAHRAAARLGGVSVAHDISPHSLRVGLEGAHAVGLNAETVLVAGDFHSLPFTTGYFDIVFCASSIHHTFRPWRVLKEILRVIRPGGVFRLENEPVGRAFCFYGFRSNRRSSFTPFESAMDERGSLTTFSSPFPGSRPEILFGMIENERMPLDLIMDTLTAESRAISVMFVPVIGKFEKAVLALPRDAELEASLARLLFEEIQAVQSLMTEKDRLLGAKLPTSDDVWRLAYQVAPQLRLLGSLSGQEAEYQTTRLFGAALQATLVKNGHGAPANEMFSRTLALNDHVYDDLPTLPGVKLHLSEQPLPAIEDGDLSALSAVYLSDQWEPYQESNGLLSMLNRGSRNRIALPPLPVAAMLLIRFYAVETSQPYRVSLTSADGKEITSVVVAQSESHLLRELFPAESNEVFVELKTLDGIPLDIPRHVRIGVSRLVPVEFYLPNDTPATLASPIDSYDYSSSPVGEVVANIGQDLPVDGGEDVRGEHRHEVDKPTKLKRLVRNLERRFRKMRGRRGAEEGRPVH